MTGSKRSTCEDDQNGDAFGEWSAPPPTCTSMCLQLECYRKSLTLLLQVVVALPH